MWSRILPPPPQRETEDRERLRKPNTSCSLFINTNCSHEAGLLVQRNTLINNTMCITKRYKIFKPISINNNLVLKLMP